MRSGFHPLSPSLDGERVRVRVRGTLESKQGATDRIRLVEIGAHC